MIKLSEWVRRLEDTIESLRKENRDLRSKVGTVAEETIQDLQKKVTELSRELLQRVKQVEDLLSSYKTLQDENKKLKSKLEQTVDEYDEDYQTFHKDDFVRFDDNFRKIFWEFLWRDSF